MPCDGYKGTKPVLDKKKNSIAHLFVIETNQLYDSFVLRML